MTGFECSTFVWQDGQRKDYVALTAHDRRLIDDYRLVRRLGIRAVREGVRWPLVDQGNGAYDWSTVDALLDALDACELTPLWDLCHYGLPDGCSPFTPECHERFVAYCRAVAAHVVPRTRAPRFFTPINEITFFAGAATDRGWMYPFAKGRYQELKLALCRMAIDAVHAIREVDPEARMLHTDPLIHEVAPPDRPDLARAAAYHEREQQYEAWDVIAGRVRPELGGSPEMLDVVGVDVYHLNQAEIGPDGSRTILEPRDPRRRPLGEMLRHVWQRYERPIVIAETSGYQDKRASWLRMVMEESLAAIGEGVDLRGVCLYPFVDIPEWVSGKPAKIGVYDLGENGRRVACPEYLDEIVRWQKHLAK